MGRDSAVVVTWTGGGRGQGVGLRGEVRGGVKGGVRGGVKRWGERSEKLQYVRTYVITSHANQCSLLQLTLTAAYVIEALAKFGAQVVSYVGLNRSNP